MPSAGTNRKPGSDGCLMVKEAEERTSSPNWGTLISVLAVTLTSYAAAMSISGEAF